MANHTNISTKRGASRRDHTGRKHSWSTCAVLILCGFTGVICFYAGLIMGATNTNAQPSLDTSAGTEQRVAKEVGRITKERSTLSLPADDSAPRFPRGVQDYIVGMARVDRDEFAQKFDMGVPLDASSDANNEIVMVYQGSSTLPENAFSATEAVSNTHVPKIDSIDEAVANCDHVNVMLTDHSPKRRQCVAIMGQYEAFHLQKFMRLPESGKLDSTLPLRLVNRGAQSSGRKSTKPPTPEDTEKYWAILTAYLSTLQEVLAELKPIADSVAVDNTITILVCNFGQSELLMNFVCSAKSRNIDLSHILVFPTDEETRDLAVGLGLAVYYDYRNYGDMPKQAAGRYADKTFMAMMMAKVFCVHQTTWLGYNVLFQDVDVIWYKDPVPYFESPASKNFDIYFQDDGNHALYYAPYSANTGFYFVRANERTRHFFNSFLLAGDLIFSTHSHQVPLVALLQEHASMYGLQVKIFPRTEDDFPGGHAFHRRKDFMKDIMAGVSLPYIFHMSWTNNKNNKVKFFRQMGEWFTKEECVQQSPEKILGHKASALELVAPCCAAEEIFSCHYMDKPSKHPCKDSPPIDKGHQSFW